MFNKFSDQDFDKGWCDLYLDIYNDIDNLPIGLKHNYNADNINGADKFGFATVSATSQVQMRA